MQQRAFWYNLELVKIQMEKYSQVYLIRIQKHVPDNEEAM